MVAEGGMLHAKSESSEKKPGSLAAAGDGDKLDKHPATTHQDSEEDSFEDDEEEEDSVEEEKVIEEGEPVNPGKIFYFNVI